jgi:hypothetical protein
MFRESTREKRMFGRPDDITEGGAALRFQGAPRRCTVPVDIEDPDMTRLDDRRERVIFRNPSSQLLKKYNVESD